MLRITIKYHVISRSQNLIHFISSCVYLIIIVIIYEIIRTANRCNIEVFYLNLLYQITQDIKTSANLKQQFISAAYCARQHIIVPHRFTCDKCCASGAVRASKSTARASRLR